MEIMVDWVKMILKRSNSAIPVRVVRGNNTIFNDAQQISSGGWHNCAVRENGTVMCWGAGSYGQLGNGSESDKRYAKIVDNGNFTNVIQVSAGHAHTCAVNEAGEVWCWGGWANGKLGVYSETNKSLPVRVLGTSSGWLSGIVQVSAGDEHTCALHYSGGAYCWGKRKNYRLTMSESNTSRSTPFAVKRSFLINMSGLINIVASWGHSCALTEDSEVVCWGKGNSGRLGSDSNSSQQYPRRVKNITTDILKGVSQISQSRDSHVCVIVDSDDSDEKIKCWGSGGSGRLGNGKSTNQNKANNVFRYDSHFEL